MATTNSDDELGGVASEKAEPKRKKVGAVTQSAAEILDGIIETLGGEVRPGQRRMVELVEDAILNRTPTAIQAGTGTGKSLGYLVPVIAGGKKTVVVVSSIVLQDQLANKDLPFLAEHHPDPVDFVVLKGRSNFACHAKAAETRVAIRAHRQAGDLGSQDALFEDLDEFEADGNEALAATKAAGLEKLDADDIEKIESILQWMKTSKTGDKAELTFEPSHDVWSRVAVGSSECPGAKKCDYGDECFAELAKLEAEDAQVIVVNAHLYGSDLATNKNLLPDHDVLIVDEAHDFADAVISSLSKEVSRIRVMQVAGMVAKVLYGKDLMRKFAAVADELNGILEKLYEDTTRENQGSPRLREGAHASRLLLKALIGARGVADQAVGDLGRARATMAKSPSKNFAALSRFDRAQMVATAFINDIDAIIAADKDHVIWVEQHGDVSSLKVADINVDKALKALVWDADTAVVLCSATLPEAVPKQLGLKNARWVDVGSPFNYRDSMLYVARHLPDPRDRGWPAAADAEIMRLLDAANGRGMVLFTSVTRMRDAVDKARKRYGKDRVLVQGDAPKRLLVEKMKTDSNKMLFATISFWQGVDIPGLPLIILDKLPFPVPTDPVVSAMKDRVRKGAPDGADPSFGLVDLPITAVRTAQGVGRLVRTADDRGVVAILDKRLATAKWRESILNILPPMRRVVTQDTVYDFLRRIS
jgi:ATP-dependent DNA helicase DinG